MTNAAIAIAGIGRDAAIVIAAIDNALTADGSKPFSPGVVTDATLAFPKCTIGVNAATNNAAVAY